MEELDWIVVPERKHTSKHSSALTLRQIYPLYSISSCSLNNCLDTIKIWKNQQRSGDLKKQLQVICDAHNEPITRLFPGSEKKNLEWTCVESVLNNSKDHNDLTPDGRQIFLIFMVYASNETNLGNPLPNKGDLLHTNKTTGMQWHRVTGRDNLFYCVDFDASLWKKKSRPWQLDCYRPVALALLGVLIAGIETGLDILKGNRHDRKASVVEALGHLRRNARLFSQLVHNDDIFTLNREFANEIGFSHGFLATRLSMFIDKISELNASEFKLPGKKLPSEDVEKELDWIRQRLSQHACFSAIDSDHSKISALESKAVINSTQKDNISKKAFFETEVVDLESEIVKLSV